MGVSKAERLQGVHDTALQEFNRIQSAVWETRKLCLAARRFYSLPGAQWEGPLAQQFQNKPMLEVNKVHLSVIRVINEYRNNRVEVDFTPRDGDTDECADTCDGLYRADAHDSGAQEARDNAFEESVGGGMGAWRLRAVYENEDDPDDKRQRIVWEPIVDADSCVFFDLNSKRQDKRDAKHCFVLTSMTREAYKAEYGDDPGTWPKGINSQTWDWAPVDLVYVAEYYRVHLKKEKLYTYQGLAGEDDEIELTDSDIEAEDDQREDDEPRYLDELQATGYTLKDTRTVKVRKVRKYIMSGGKILEDCGFIAGKYIPIVVTYGKRWFVDGIERCMGHVQLAMDAQRLKNMQLSKLAEISALSSVEKPVVTPQMMAGHTEMWSRDNIENFPYLLLNTVTDVDGNEQLPQLQYTRSPQIPPAMAALLQLTEEDMKDLLGNQQAGEEMQPNVSGKTVELIQNRLDMQSYIYMSNHAKGVQYEGLVWLSMANDIYIEEKRRMKTMASDGAVSSTQINTDGYDASRGMYRKNDIGSAKFDVYVDVGPTSSSKRASTVRALTGVMALLGAVDPQTTQVVASAVMMNIEGEGMGDLRDYFRWKLVQGGVVKPTEEEAKKLQEQAANQQPDPQAAFLMAEAQKSQAAAGKAQADTALAAANTEKTQAQTAQILAQIPQDQVRSAIDAARSVQEAITPPEPKNPA